jgi:hypothetical protein
VLRIADLISVRPEKIADLDKLFLIACAEVVRKIKSRSRWKLPKFFLQGLHVTTAILIHRIVQPFLRHEVVYAICFVPFRLVHVAVNIVTAGIRTDADGGNCS